MFNTMTLPRRPARLCGALLFFLLGAWARRRLYHVGPRSRRRGRGARQAYTIAVEEPAATRADEAADEVPISRRCWHPPMPARAKRCSASAGPATSSTAATAIGPHLNGVVGRPVAIGRGLLLFRRAGAMRPRRLDARDLNEFLTNPKGYRPGHQDVLRRSEEARGPREPDRLSGNDATDRGALATTRKGRVCQARAFCMSAPLRDRSVSARASQLTRHDACCGRPRGLAFAFSRSGGRP